VGTLNLRSKIDLSAFTELRQLWTNRCLQVEKRKASEKEIDKANKTVIKTIVDQLQDRSYLINCLMCIKDDGVYLEKRYDVINTKTNAISYFSITMKLQQLMYLLYDDKVAKELPKLIERKTRSMDRLVKTQFKNHTVRKVSAPFVIQLDTSTKYSF
jgi:hypothetical protein